MRHKDWPKRLSKAIEAAQNRPFEWGVNDCCTFAAECVKEISNYDLFPQIKWADEKSALKQIKKNGGFEAFFDSTLERIEHPMMAQRGDVVLFDNGRLTVSICSGLALVSPGLNGLESTQLDKAVAAWRID